MIRRFATELKRFCYNVVISRPENVDVLSIIEFFKRLKTTYPSAKKIHLILDQSGYHRSKAVRSYARKSAIKLHYLPPYSPNLNPIERLWKVMNERVRNNRFFTSAKEFRESIDQFFQITLPSIAHTLRTRINDNFQILNPDS